MLSSRDEPIRVRLEISEMERAFDYIADKFRTARRKIEHSAFSPEITGFAQYSASYREAVEALIARNQVYYRYVAGIGPDTERKSHRLHGIRQRLEQRRDIAEADSRYSAKVVFTDAHYNGLNFFLFDDTELAIYVPGTEGEPGVGLFTQDRSDVTAYARNFSGLWHKARPTNSLASVEHVEAQLAVLGPTLAIEHVNRPPLPTRRSEAEIVLEACRQLPETARVLAHRSRAGKTAFEIADEYDVHDLLQATLRSYIPYTVREDPIGKVAGMRSSRADISIEQLGILIEVKYARSATDQARIAKQFSEDLLMYARWPGLKTLIFLIYNSAVLPDPNAFLRLAGSQELSGVRFEIEIALV